MSGYSEENVSYAAESERASAAAESKPARMVTQFGIVERTRRSLAEQLREALDGMAAVGTIESWSADYGAAPVPAKVYRVHRAGVADDFTPGECMDFVNEHGYDVAIGKP